MPRIAQLRTNVVHSDTLSLREYFHRSGNSYTTRMYNSNGALYVILVHTSSGRTFDADIRNGKVVRLTIEPSEESFEKFARLLRDRLEAATPR